MDSIKILKILAAIFAMRAVNWSDRDAHAALAYDNAFDMLAYAANGSWDCLSQFCFADEAKELVNRVGSDIDFWDLEEIIKGEKLK